MKYMFIFGIFSSLYALRDPFQLPVDTKCICKAIGTVAGSDAGCALLVMQGKEYYVRKGDVINDYQVLQILDSAVVLKGTHNNELQVINFNLH